MAKVLKDNVFSEIRQDNGLLVDIADALGVSIMSLPGMMQRKSRRFTEYQVLVIIAKHLKRKPEDLLIEDAKVAIE